MTLTDTPDDDLRARTAAVGRKVVGKARGVNLPGDDWRFDYHDPGTGRFAAKGTVTPGKLKALLTGNAKARNEVLTELRDKLDSHDGLLNEYARALKMGDKNRAKQLAAQLRRLVIDAPPAGRDDRNAWDAGSREIAKLLSAAPDRITKGNAPNITPMAAPPTLAKEAPDVAAAVGYADWQTTQPWNATLTDVQAGKFPWIAHNPNMTSWIAARWHDGKMEVPDKWFGEDNELLVHHEVGHAVQKALFADLGDVGPLLAPFVNGTGWRSPFAGSDDPTEHSNQPAEIAADAFAWLSIGQAGNYNQPGTDELFAAVAAKAKEMGFDLPPRDQTQATYDWKKLADGTWAANPGAGQQIRVKPDGTWTSFYEAADGTEKLDIGAADTVDDAKAAAEAALAKRKLADIAEEVEAPVPAPDAPPNPALLEASAKVEATLAEFKDFYSQQAGEFGPSSDVDAATLTKAADLIRAHADALQARAAITGDPTDDSVAKAWGESADLYAAAAAEKAAGTYTVPGPPPDAPELTPTVPTMVRAAAQANGKITARVGDPGRMRKFAQGDLLEVGYKDDEFGYVWVPAANGKSRKYLVHWDRLDAWSSLSADGAVQFATPDTIQGVVKGASGPTAVRVADGRLWRLGAPRGSTLEVTHLNNEFALTTITKPDGSTRDYKVRWERLDGLPPTAAMPGAAPRVAPASKPFVPGDAKKGDIVAAADIQSVDGAQLPPKFVDAIASGVDTFTVNGVVAGDDKTMGVWFGYEDANGNTHDVTAGFPVAPSAPQAPSPQPLGDTIPFDDVIPFDPQKVGVGEMVTASELSDVPGVKLSQKLDSHMQQEGGPTTFVVVEKKPVTGGMIGVKFSYKDANGEAQLAWADYPNPAAAPDVPVVDSNGNTTSQMSNTAFTPAGANGKTPEENLSFLFGKINQPVPALGSPEYEAEKDAYFSLGTEGIAGEPEIMWRLADLLAADPDISPYVSRKWRREAIMAELVEGGVDTGSITELAKASPKVDDIDAMGSLAALASVSGDPAFLDQSMKERVVKELRGAADSYWVHGDGSKDDVVKAAILERIAALTNDYHWQSTDALGETMLKDWYNDSGWQTYSETVTAQSGQLGASRELNILHTLGALGASNAFEFTAEDKKWLDARIAATSENAYPGYKWNPNAPTPELMAALGMKGTSLPPYVAQTPAKEAVNKAQTTFEQATNAYYFTKNDSTSLNHGQLADMATEAAIAAQAKADLTGNAADVIDVDHWKAKAAEHLTIHQEQENASAIMGLKDTYYSAESAGTPGAATVAKKIADLYQQQWVLTGNGLYETEAKHWSKLAGEGGVLAGGGNATAEGFDKAALALFNDYDDAVAKGASDSILLSKLNDIAAQYDAKAQFTKDPLDVESAKYWHAKADQLSKKIGVGAPDATTPPPQTINIGNVQVGDVLDGAALKAHPDMNFGIASHPLSDGPMTVTKVATTSTGDIFKKRLVLSSGPDSDKVVVYVTVDSSTPLTLSNDLTSLDAAKANVKAKLVDYDMAYPVDKASAALAVAKALDAKWKLSGSIVDKDNSQAWLSTAKKKAAEAGMNPADFHLGDAAPSAGIPVSAVKVGDTFGVDEFLATANHPGMTGSLLGALQAATGGEVKVTDIETNPTSGARKITVSINGVSNPNGFVLFAKPDVVLGGAGAGGGGGGVKAADLKSGDVIDANDLVEAASTLPGFALSADLEDAIMDAKASGAQVVVKNAGSTGDGSMSVTFTIGGKDDGGYWGYIAEDAVIGGTLPPETGGSPGPVGPLTLDQKIAAAMEAYKDPDSNVAFAAAAELAHAHAQKNDDPNKTVSFGQEVTMWAKEAKAKAKDAKISQTDVYLKAGQAEHAYDKDPGPELAAEAAKLYAQAAVLSSSSEGRAKLFERASHFQSLADGVDATPSSPTADSSGYMDHVNYFTDILQGGKYSDGTVTGYSVKKALDAYTLDPLNAKADTIAKLTAASAAVAAAILDKKDNGEDYTGEMAGYNWLTGKLTAVKGTPVDNNMMQASIDKSVAEFGNLEFNDIPKVDQLFTARKKVKLAKQIAADYETIGDDAGAAKWNGSADSWKQVTAELEKDLGLAPGEVPKAPSAHGPMDKPDQVDAWGVAPGGGPVAAVEAVDVDMLRQRTLAAGQLRVRVKDNRLSKRGIKKGDVVTIEVANDKAARVMPEGDRPGFRASWERFDGIATGGESTTAGLGFVEAFNELADDPSRGSVMAFDEGAIEGYTMRVRGVQYKDAEPGGTGATKPAVQFAFKIRPSHDEAMRTAMEGADNVHGAALPKEIDGVVDPTQPGWNFSDATTQVKRVTLPDGRVAVVRWYRAKYGPDVATSNSNNPYALHNLVQVHVLDDGKPVTQADVDALFAQLGVKAGYPQATSQKDYATKLLDSLFHAPHSSKSGTQRAFDDYGITPEDVVLERVGNQVVPMLSEEMAKKLADKTGTRGFHHAFYSGGKHAPQAMTGEGLLATTTRWSEGVGVSGMSSAEDVSTGGGDYVFTRQSPSLDTNASSVGVMIDASQALRRLDWYAYPSDMYGKQHASAKASRDNLVNVGSHHGSRETMFRRSVPIEHWAYVTLDSQQRDKVLAELDARGVTHVNGIPVREFVRRPHDPIPKQGSDGTGYRYEGGAPTVSTSTPGAAVPSTPPTPTTGATSTGTEKKVLDIVPGDKFTWNDIPDDWTIHSGGFHAGDDEFTVVKVSGSLSNGVTPSTGGLVIQTVDSDGNPYDVGILDGDTLAINVKSAASTPTSGGTSKVTSKAPSDLAPGDKFTWEAVPDNWLAGTGWAYSYEDKFTVESVEGTNGGFTIKVVDSDGDEFNFKVSYGDESTIDVLPQAPTPTVGKKKASAIKAGDTFSLGALKAAEKASDAGDVGLTSSLYGVPDGTVVTVESVEVTGGGAKFTLTGPDGLVGVLYTYPETELPVGGADFAPITTEGV